MGGGGGGGGGTRKAASAEAAAAGRGLGEGRIDDYYVVDWGKVLGRGHYATVHRGQNLKTRRVVAVKKIQTARTREESLKAEINVLRAVGHHDNIVTLLDVFVTSTDVLLVMEPFALNAVDGFVVLTSLVLFVVLLLALDLWGKVDGLHRLDAALVIRRAHGLKVLVPSFAVESIFGWRARRGTPLALSLTIR